MNISVLRAAVIFTAFCAIPALDAAESKSQPQIKPLPFQKPATPAPEKPAAPSKAAETSRPLPFLGKVTAIDPAGKSFSLNGKDKDRVFNVTDKTVFVGKGNAPAKLSSLSLGEEVRGSYTKAGDAWTANKVYIGPKEK